MGRQLYLDTVRGYTRDSYNRSYRLDHFPIKAQVMPEYWRIAPDLRHPKHKLIRAINKLMPRELCSYFAERQDTQPADLLHLNSRRSRITLHGYWQDEAYFSDMREYIHAELAPPPPRNASQLEKGLALSRKNSVFLHIRRKQYSPILGEDYYQNAIDLALRDIDNPVFVVFGDDIPWARSTLRFGPSEVEFQEFQANDELTDIWLMSRCRHAIIANSSFSWWGAWLGGQTNESRKVWAPEATGFLLKNAPGWTLIPATLTMADKKSP